MPKSYHHLTELQRCQIFTLKERGDSQKIISSILKVDKSTISRELKRNSNGALKIQMRQIKIYIIRIINIYRKICHNI